MHIHRFFVHATANFGVVVLSLKCMYATLIDPLHALDVSVHSIGVLEAAMASHGHRSISHMIGGSSEWWRLLSSSDVYSNIGFPRTCFNWGSLGPG